MKIEELFEAKTDDELLIIVTAPLQDNPKMKSTAGNSYAIVGELHLTNVPKKIRPRISNGKAGTVVKPDVVAATVKSLKAKGENLGAFYSGAGAGINAYKLDIPTKTMDFEKFMSAIEKS